MRLAILTCNSMSSNEVFRNIINKNHKDIKAVIVTSQVSGSFLQKIKGYFKLFKKMSFKFFVYKIIEGQFYMLYNRLALIFGSKKKLMKDLANNYKIQYYNIKNINSAESVQLLKSLKLDLILVYSGPILKKEVLQAPKIACLNCHGSILPYYKGTAQYVWYLINNESQGGVTIHLMTEKLDEGDIIKQKKFVIEKKDTAWSLHYKIAENGSKLFLNAIEGYKSGKIVPKAQQKGGFYCSIPSKSDMKKLPWGKLIK